MSCFYSSAYSHRAAGTSRCRRHLPLDQTQRQQHHRRRTDHPEGGGVPHHYRKLGRDPRGWCPHLQALASGPGRGVRDQGPAVQTWRRGNGTAGTTAHHQDQMCRWVTFVVLWGSGHCFVWFSETCWSDHLSASADVHIPPTQERFSELVKVVLVLLRLQAQPNQEFLSVVYGSSTTSTQVLLNMHVFVHAPVFPVCFHGGVLAPHEVLVCWVTLGCFLLWNRWCVF